MVREEGGRLERLRDPERVWQVSVAVLTSSLEVGGGSRSELDCGSIGEGFEEGGEATRACRCAEARVTREDEEDAEELLGREGGGGADCDC